jgi:hypothetical protein
MVSSVYQQEERDDDLSATELRQQKYRKEEPRLRFNELVIEDYVGQRQRDALCADGEAPGAFLLGGDDAELSTSAPASDNPWFAAPTTHHPCQRTFLQNYIPLARFQKNRRHDGQDMSKMELRQLMRFQQHTVRHRQHSAHQRLEHAVLLSRFL